jgi:DNA-binding transcriptional regulator YhcF (GntR family)
VKTTALPEVANQAEKLRTFTGWKLDLMRAVRADHKVIPAASALFDAFMDHVNAETKKAWPSEGMLAISLGVNRKTIRKYLQMLIDAKWLKPAGRSKRGTTIYEVESYRMNQVLDMLAIEIDRFREKEAERQSRRRVMRNVCPDGGAPIKSVSVHTGGALSVHAGGYEHLHRTPSSEISCEEETSIGRRFSNER